MTYKALKIASFMTSLATGHLKFDLEIQKLSLLDPNNYQSQEPEILEPEAGTLPSFDKELHDYKDI